MCVCVCVCARARARVKAADFHVGTLKLTWEDLGFSLLAFSCLQARC